MNSIRIKIWQECNPLIAIAINNFQERWTPFSTESKTHSLSSLLSEIIEPAWKKYIQLLEKNYSVRAIFSIFSFSLITCTDDFRKLENAILENFPEAIDAELHATLETMRELFKSCSLKKPKYLKNGRLDRRPNEICDFCGENTELFLSIKRGQNILGYDPDEGTARLSVVYCSKHRPKYLNQTRNPLYQSANRNKISFKTELSRLERQCVSTSDSRAQSGNPEIDLFYVRLQAREAFFLTDVSNLRKEARRLVDTRIDDTKKRIIMLRAEGLTLNTIANLLDMKSRQAVSKALASVPMLYRFDLNLPINESMQCQSKFKQSALIIQQIIINLGELITSALNDSDIYEIMLNPDGALWTGKKGGENIQVGKMSPEHATNLIQSIARYLTIPLTKDNPIVTGDLPFIAARFTVTLPPVVYGPTITIRKRQV